MEIVFAFFQVVLFFYMPWFILSFPSTTTQAPSQESRLGIGNCAERSRSRARLHRAAWHLCVHHGTMELRFEVNREDHSRRTVLKGAFDVSVSTPPLRQGDIAEHLGNIQLVMRGPKVHHGTKFTT